MSSSSTLGDLLRQVDRIPLSEIVASRIPLQKRGRHYKGICPFHSDQNIGSFIVTDDKGIYKCFSCNASGKAAKFIQEFDHLETLEEAVYRILAEHVVPETEVSSERSVRIPKKKESEVVKPGPFREMDEVFRAFIDKCSLQSKHRTYLYERGLNDEAIQRGLYFSFPDQRNTKMMKELVEQFGESGLEQIPGFYYDSQKKQWRFARYKGIGFGIQNAQGQVVGIQIRQDSQTLAPGQSRYSWFSSSFAIEGQASGVSKGTSASAYSNGAPADVVIPSTIQNRTVFITEGRFKAEEITKQKGSIAISIQGVTSWKPAIRELVGLLESPVVRQSYQGKDFQIECVFSAFDADMHYRYGVYKQLKKMTDVLACYFPCYYITWDEKYGKGIDDVFINGHGEYIYRYDKTSYDAEQRRVMELYLEVVMNIELPLPEKEFEKKMQAIDVIAFATFRKQFFFLQPLPKGLRSKEHEQYRIEKHQKRAVVSG